MSRLLITILLLASSISFSHAEPSVNHAGEHKLQLPLDEFHQLGGQLATAAAGRLRDERVLPAQVRLNAEAVAHVSPRFAAQITAVNVNTGDQVKAGQVLALAESSDTLASFPLKSLIDGVVISRHITLGEHLQPTDTAFVVADLSRLWLDIALYPQQLAKVKVGMSVHLSARYGPDPVEAKIDYIAPLVSETTRTGLARVFLANPNKQWKPGMFVEARLTLSDFSVPVRVPQSAVITLADTAVVFVREPDHWRAQPVELGRHDRIHVELLSGLHKGEQYAAQGGFFLKAQLEKDELEAGHNH